MSETLLDMPASGAVEPDAGTADDGASRPAYVPEKFWDPQAGNVRIEALAKSYGELERRMGAAARIPGEDAAPEEISAFRKALGVPDTPDLYELPEAAKDLGADAEVNRRLHEAGFSQAQAALVYELAAERMTPLIQDMAAEFEAERQVQRLSEHFGGREKWSEVSRQISAWGKANLPDHVLNALGTTYEGVVSLHRMMSRQEPALGRSAGAVEDGPSSEEDLRRLMRDPKYWRDRDPGMIGKITDGFRRLYPGE